MSDLERVIGWARTQSDADRWRLICEIGRNLGRGNIRNLCFYLEGLSDLSIFNDCFPRGIRPSDVDGEVEINGRLLRIDWKRPTVLGVNGGERYTAENLARHRGDVTMFVYAEGADVKAVEIFMRHRDPGWSEGIWAVRSSGRLAADAEAVQTLATAWAEAADQNEDLKWMGE